MAAGGSRVLVRIRCVRASEVRTEACSASGPSEASRRVLFQASFCSTQENRGEPEVGGVPKVAQKSGTRIRVVSALHFHH